LVDLRKVEKEGFGNRIKGSSGPAGEKWKKKGKRDGGTA